MNHVEQSTASFPGNKNLSSLYEYYIWQVVLDLFKKQQVVLEGRNLLQKGKEIGRKRWKEEGSEEVLAHLVLRKEEEIESVEAFVKGG